MNHLEKNYCQDCDYNNLEISFKKYKISKDKKKISNKIQNNNFIPINITSLPDYYCNLCNNNHKIHKCPLLLDNISLCDTYHIKNKLIKPTIKKSLLKKSLKCNIDFDICYQLSNLNIKLTNKKRVKFNLSTTH
tara:strand:- start:4337 stop:4738 length:402 start_codon:yes stop_codon:yes gene_type:complete